MSDEQGRRNPAVTTAVPIDQWWAEGQRLPYSRARGDDRGPRAFQIFCRTIGSGPWLTLLHGFPTSSWDYSKVAGDLAARHRLLLFDFLGFGDSDKPRGHEYSLLEQADVAEAMWSQQGVAETRLVAHDYGVSVALELLSRQAEGRLPTRIESVLFLNGGLYVDRYRPILIQSLLQWPVVGTLISALLSERTFTRNLGKVFAPERRPSVEEMHEHWRSVVRRGGRGNTHRLIRYVSERRRNQRRWEAALADTPVPLRFVWGMRDPISGPAMMEELRRRRPGASIRELPDVGHYPQVEDPETVVNEVLSFKLRTPSSPQSAFVPPGS